MRSHWRVCTRSRKHALARSSLHTMTGRAPAHAAAHRRTLARSHTLGWPLQGLRAHVGGARTLCQRHGRVQRVVRIPHWRR